ncbi:MAG: SxtJ family membrane protein [Chloroherpetonaceae bacterium]|nr:SxtJ family membrane protein [Chloroherpetonaceae bacterium]MCS7210295.1 SxtJ family membrane protein [Chloroherpetonaceae bacterium]MDW8019786.1 SxtJ family membrane protein [Chloroherpetonaceae bacterium]MDW8465280.1 SxtJ family membrane protein [Chloroherpetonaceae bacterium]
MHLSHKAELAIVTGFLVLFLIFQQAWLVYVACTFGIAFLLSATLTRVILWAWFKLSEALGYLSQRILLSTLFFLLLTPLALLRRLQHKNPLFLHAPPPNSMFKARLHRFSRIDFEKTW